MNAAENLVLSLNPVRKEKNGPMNFLQSNYRRSRFYYPSVNRTSAVHSRELRCLPPIRFTNLNENIDVPVVHSSYSNTFLLCIADYEFASGTKHLY